MAAAMPISWDAFAWEKPVLAEETRVTMDWPLAKGNVALAHDPEVHGPQRQLGQNSGQNRGNIKGRVQSAGDQPGRHSGQSRKKQRQKGIDSLLDNEHGADAAAQSEAAVHGQIRDVQQLVCNVNAQDHQPPEHALPTGIQKTGPIPDKNSKINHDIYLPSV